MALKEDGYIVTIEMSIFLANHRTVDPIRAHSLFCVILLFSFSLVVLSISSNYYYIIYYIIQTERKFLFLFIYIIINRDIYFFQNLEKVDQQLLRYIHNFTINNKRKKIYVEHLTHTHQHIHYTQSLLN